MKYNNNIYITKKKRFSHDKTNIFLITTAFQLLCAIEASQFFQNRNSILVLLFYGNNNKDELQLRNMYKLFNYNILVEVKFSKLKKFELMNETINLLRVINELYSKYDKVFTGFYSANIRRIIANINYNELYLIDDGVYTISIHNELFNSNFEQQTTKYIRKYSEKKRKTLYKKLRFYIFHYFRAFYFYIKGYRNDTANIKKVNFFTMYELEAIQNEKIIIHDFHYLKSLCNNFNQKTHQEGKYIYFLGQPLDRAFGLSDDIYIGLVKRYLYESCLEDKKVIYIPHRAENKNIVKHISNIENIEILFMDMPFELYCLEKNIKINRLISFLSTALYSIKTIYPDTYVEAIKIKGSEKIDLETRHIYKVFKKKGIKIYELQMSMI